MKGIFNSLSYGDRCFESHLTLIPRWGFPNFVSLVSASRLQTFAAATRKVQLSIHLQTGAGWSC